MEFWLFRMGIQDLKVEALLSFLFLRNLLCIAKEYSKKRGKKQTKRVCKSLQFISISSDMDSILLR